MFILKLSRKITSLALVFLMVVSMAVTLPSSSVLNTSPRLSSVSSTATVKSQPQTYSIINSAVKYYSGDYYNPIGGLDKLTSRTDSNGLIQDLRALIGYSDITAKTTLGTSIKGTDSKHPKYSGTGSNTLSYWYDYSERTENDTHNGIKMFYTDQYTTGSWNREHVWPQSLSGGLFGKTGGGCDLHHVRPTYDKDNSARGNLPYGDVTDTTKTVYANGSGTEVIAHIGASQGKTAFEPKDSYKGDIARIYAYMVVHYESLYNLLPNAMVGDFKTLVAWNNLDPVDDIELNRNNVGFKAQGNRNPFIDCPDLINIIWGGGSQSGPVEKEKFNISYLLKNVTSGNTAAQIEDGLSYQTVLTPDDGYELTQASVTVTMGGKDITSSSFTQSTGEVYIEEVTADLTIAATADKIPEPEPPEPIDITYNYEGTYYDVIGGLQGLTTRTDTESILGDLRALIGYTGTSSQTSFGTTISGTDAKHPTYSGSGSNSLAYWYKLSDRAENDTHEGFKLFYTSHYTTTNNWNREHVWPQSQSGGLYGTTGAGADLHHIRPTYNKDNSTRGNLPYGEVPEPTKTVYVNGDSSGEVIAHIGPIGGQTAFEPDDSYKGDIARIIAYMVTHYESMYDIVGNVMVGEYDTLVKWNNLDPVDAVEINRNNVAFQAQGNRNPYIDCPDLINIIWGNAAPSTDKYSVSYALSGVTSSNKAASVAKNSSYATVLTPDEGYAIKEVTVKMGGKDITADCYKFDESANRGTISIDSVTGTLIIRAIAEKQTVIDPDNFVKVYSASQLTVGSKLVIAFGTDDNKPAAAGSVTKSTMTTEKVATSGDYAYPEQDLVVWEILAGTDINVFKLRNVETGKYLAGSGNSTDVVLADDDGVDLYLYPDETGTFVLVNDKNNGRFLGSNSEQYTGLKWYSASNITSTAYPHLTTFYVKSAGGAVIPEHQDYKYEIVESDVVITKWLSEASNVKVPEEVNGKWVVAIDDNAFAGIETVETVSIPNSVTDIGDGVFKNCTKLRSVTFGENVAYVGDDLFAGCISLREADIPAALDEVPDGTFNGCEKLSKVTISSNVKRIGSNAFKGCISIYRLALPDSVTEIGEGAFSDCSSMTDFKLPRQVKSISANTFANCSSISKITVPVTVDKIGAGAFKGCTSAAELVIPTKLPSAREKRTRFNKSEDTSLKSDLTIGEEAFADCVNLIDVRLSQNISTVSANAFDGCRKLRMVGIFNKNAAIGTDAFSNTAQDFVLYGYKNSSAEKAGYSFKALEEADKASLTAASKKAARDKATAILSGKYTEASIYALESAHRRAIELLKVNTNSYDLDNVEYKLNDAVKNLKVLAYNFDDLNYMIELAGYVEQEGYSEESYSYFQSVLADAVELSKSKNVSQDEVDAMYNKLYNAMYNLEYDHYNY